MSIRAWLIRVMLTFLALAALGGVLGVMTPGTDAIWRLVWTAGTTALACALMLGATRFIERPETRNSSLYAMAVILAEFLLALSLIWDLPEALLPGRHQDWMIALAMLWIGLTQLPAVGFMRLVARLASHVAGIIGVAGSGVATLLTLAGIVAEMLARPTVYSSWRLLELGGWLEACVIVVAVSLVGFETNRRRWRWIGVGAAVVAYVLLGPAIWNSWSHPPDLFPWMASLAVIVAHANISMHAPLRPGQFWLRYGTIAAVAGSAILIDLIVYERNPPELHTRLAAAMGICAACGSAAMAILARTNLKLFAPAIVPSDVKEISITCPNCQRKQTLPLGDGACANCGLLISIKVAEPRCAQCGYLLYMIKSPRCPECGAPVSKPNEVLAPAMATARVTTYEHV
jgi:ssDNA-binding Zn-finger/Zn-ribbon topoisomerase 1